MQKSVALKVVCVTLSVALLFLIGCVSVSAYDSSVSVDFASADFTAVVQKYGTDDVIDVTSRVVFNPSDTYKSHSVCSYAFPSEYSSGYSKLLTIPLYGFSLYADTDYNFTFDFSQSFYTRCSFFAQLYFIDQDGNSEHFELINEEGHFTSPTDFTGSFHTPSFSGPCNVNLLIMVSSQGGVSTLSQIFYFGKFLFEVDSPLFGDHYENDTSEIDELNNQIIAIEGALPSMDDVSFDDLLKDVNVAAYNNGFVAVNNVFNRLVGAAEIAPVILFCLAIGLCTYLLGRRLKN